MKPDLWSLYTLMQKSRLFEEAVTQLWKDGLISGEMHLGTGEEAIVAGIISQLKADDAMALDHRGTPPLLMRGVDPVLILRELLGRPDGLCGGKGGHSPPLPDRRKMPGPIFEGGGHPLRQLQTLPLRRDPAPLRGAGMAVLRLAKHGFHEAPRPEKGDPGRRRGRLRFRNRKGTPVDQDHPPGGSPEKAKGHPAGHPDGPL